MQKLNVPKVEVNNGLAIKETIKKQLLEKFKKMPNKTIINFEELMKDVEVPNRTGIVQIKHQAMTEFKTIISNQVTFVNQNCVIDRNKEVIENIRVMKEKEEALKATRQAVREMIEIGKPISKNGIVQHLIRKDFRNRNIKTYVGIFYDSGMIPELQPELQTKESDEEEMAI